MLVNGLYGRESKLLPENKIEIHFRISNTWWWTLNGESYRQIILYDENCNPLKRIYIILCVLRLKCSRLFALVIA